MWKRARRTRPSTKEQTSGAHSQAVHAGKPRMHMMVYHILLAGADGVGKTALQKQFLDNYFPVNNYPTLDDSYRKQCMIDGERCLIEVFDNSGADQYKAMRDLVYRQADGIIFVYSVDSWSSLESIKPLREECLAAKCQDYAPMVLVGNQCDRKQDEWEVVALEGKVLAREFGCPHIEMSARTGFNVDAGFYQLIREIWRSESETKPVRDREGKDGQPAMKA